MWLQRFGALSGVILGLSIGVPGAVEAFTGETSATGFVLGVGVAFAAPTVTGLYLHHMMVDRPASVAIRARIDQRLCGRGTARQAPRRRTSAASPGRCRAASPGKRHPRPAATAAARPPGPAR